jgi:hypothetical protein
MVLSGPSGSYVVSRCERVSVSRKRTRPTSKDWKIAPVLARSA